MASSGNAPAWVDASNEYVLSCARGICGYRSVCTRLFAFTRITLSRFYYSEKEETSPLMGSGEVALQDSEKDVEEQKEDAASYGALDTSKEDTLQKDWQKEEPKKKKPKKKAVRVSDSIHEILVNRPHRSFCQHVFIFFQIVAIVSSLCLFTTQIIPIIIAPPSKIGYLPFALR
jgi:hypothetical protein